MVVLPCYLFYGCRLWTIKAKTRHNSLSIKVFARGVGMGSKERDDKKMEESQVTEPVILCPSSEFSIVWAYFSSNFDLCQSVQWVFLLNNLR